jgi:hypothetical protein
MAQTRINNAKAIQNCDNIVDELDTIGGSLEFYDNTQPSNVDDAAGATPIVNISLPANVFQPAVDGNPGGQATADPANLPLSALAVVSGGGSTVLTWFRVKNSGGTAIWDGDVSAGGGGGDIELDSTTITDGQQLNVNTWMFTAPEIC